MRKNNENGDILESFKIMLKSAVVSTVLMFCTTLVFAGAVSLFRLAENVQSIGTMTIWALSSAAAGYVSLLGIGKRGMVFGAVSGAVMFLLALAIGLIISGGATSAGELALKFATAIICGAIGGLLSVNRQKR